MECLYEIIELAKNVHENNLEIEKNEETYPLMVLDSPSPSMAEFSSHDWDPLSTLNNNSSCSSMHLPNGLKRIANPQQSTAISLKARSERFTLLCDRLVSDQGLLNECVSSCLGLNGGDMSGCAAKAQFLVSFPLRLLHISEEHGRQMLKKNMYWRALASTWTSKLQTAWKTKRLAGEDDIGLLAAVPGASHLLVALMKQSPEAASEVVVKTLSENSFLGAFALIVCSLAVEERQLLHLTFTRTLLRELTATSKEASPSEMLLRALFLAGPIIEVKLNDLHTFSESDDNFDNATTEFTVDYLGLENLAKTAKEATCTVLADMIRIITEASVSGCGEAVWQRVLRPCLNRNELSQTLGVLFGLPFNSVLETRLDGLLNRLTETVNDKFLLPIGEAFKSTALISREDPVADSLIADTLASVLFTSSVIPGYVRSDNLSCCQCKFPKLSFSFQEKGGDSLHISSEAIFRGIEGRFSTNVKQLRRNGVLIAVCYFMWQRELHPPSKDAIDDDYRVNFEEFPLCIEEWLAEHTNSAARVAPCFQQQANTAMFLAVQQGQPGALLVGENRLASIQALLKGVGAGCAGIPDVILPLVGGFTYPLDPCANITVGNLYFERQPAGMPSNSEEGQIQKKESEKAVFMRPFGLIKLATIAKKSNSDVKPYTTVVEAYRALCGLARKPNENDFDRNNAIEGALNSLPELLRTQLTSSSQSMLSSSLKRSENNNKTERELLTVREKSDMLCIIDEDSASLQKTLSEEAKADSLLASMAASLATALVAVELNFPPDIIENLNERRLESLALLIFLAPLVTLHQLSSMLYHCNYSVGQRVFIHHALQAAMRQLAGNEVESKQNETFDVPDALTSPVFGNEERDKTALYPPLSDSDDGESEALLEAQNIVKSRVESRTRRWGYAVKGRTERRLLALEKEKRRKQNRLVFFAEAFLTCLLQYHDEKERNGKTLHNFSFFSETDMLYAPAELLRSIATLFENISMHLSMVARLTVRVLPFLEQAVNHGNATVRGQAWVTTSIVFECAVRAAKELGGEDLVAAVGSSLERQTRVARKNVGSEDSTLARKGMLLFLSYVAGGLQS